MKSRIVHWLGLVVVAFLLMIVAGITGVYLVTGVRMNRTWQVRAKAPPVPTSPEAIERGRHVAMRRACAACHGESYGGRVLMDEPWLGRVAGNNLTAGRGGLGHYSDEDWVLAIRHGLRREGTPLFLMPSHEYVDLTEGELVELIAYLKSLPPVDQPPMRVQVGPMLRLLDLTGEVVLIAAERIDHAAIEPLADR